LTIGFAWGIFFTVGEGVLAGEIGLPRVETLPVIAEESKAYEFGRCRWMTPAPLLNSSVS